MFYLGLTIIDLLIFAGIMGPLLLTATYVAFAPDESGPLHERRSEKNQPKRQ